jgi:hypothetical protein
MYDHVGVAQAAGWLRTGIEIGWQEPPNSAGILRPIAMAWGKDLLG